MRKLNTLGRPRSRLGARASALGVASVLTAAVPGAAAAGCVPGIYGGGADAFVVIGPTLPAPAVGQRYLFRDGRRGLTSDAAGSVTCEADVVTYTSPSQTPKQWSRIKTVESEVAFDSDATRLVGQLIEPPGPPDPKRPLVVLVHGSEKYPAIGNVYAYMLAAQGVSAFVYDKRGTGTSGGEYSQNFELLADDVAAALTRARSVAAGRFGRAGFFGGSQGGWVAPLATTRSQADFVAIGFGLVVSPIEEDREQMLDEAAELKLDDKAVAQIERLSQLTARVVRSHFEAGLDDLARFRREVGTAPWVPKINGEYSGDMLRMSDADLRRIGRARFDNLGLIWGYDAVPVLKDLTVPLLWVFAGADREAPIAKSRAVLTKLAATGQRIDLFLFPDTDHGIFEFRTNPDGTRTPTKIADGYLKLLADWIKSDMHPSYGHAERVR